MDGSYRQYAVTIQKTGIRKELCPRCNDYADFERVVVERDYIALLDEQSTIRTLVFPPETFRFQEQPYGKIDPVRIHLTDRPLAIVECEKPYISMICYEQDGEIARTFQRGTVDMRFTTRIDMLPGEKDARVPIILPRRPPEGALDPRLEWTDPFAFNHGDEDHKITPENYVHLLCLIDGEIEELKWD